MLNNIIKNSQKEKKFLQELVEDSFLQNDFDNRFDKAICKINANYLRRLEEDIKKECVEN